MLQLKDKFDLFKLIILVYLIKFNFTLIILMKFYPLIFIY
jgi:hypothetical protein